MEKSANLFEVLFSVIAGRLGVDDAEVLQIVACRLGNDQLNRQFSPALLGIDDAIQVLDRTDYQVIHDAQAKVKVEASARVDFVRAYRERRERVRDVLAKAQPKEKASRKRRRGSEPAAPAYPSTISQATAKAFVPPGAHIWRGVSRCDWNGHLEPFRRVRAAWSRHGEEGAMVEVLKMLWQQHCEKEGLPYPDACPHKDRLFSAAPASSSSQA